MMALTVEQIVAKIPHKSFPVIELEPDYNIIHDMWNSSAVIYPTLQLHWLEVITGTLGS